MAEAAADSKGSRCGGEGLCLVHCQVRRIREEDLRIGEGTGEGLSAWDRDLIAILHLHAQVDAFFSSDQIHRFSPLGNKTAINSPLR